MGGGDKRRGELLLYKSATQGCLIEELMLTTKLSQGAEVDGFGLEGQERLVAAQTVGRFVMTRRTGCWRCSGYYRFATCYRSPDLTFAQHALIGGHALFGGQPGFHAYFW